MIDELRRLTARWQRKIALMVAHAIIEFIDDGHEIQQLQLTANSGVIWDGVQRFQEFGFASVPMPGAEAVVVAIGGLRSRGIVIATEDRRYRVRGLPGGAACLYDASGTRIVLNSDGTVTVIAAGTVTFETLRLQVTGDIIDQTASGNAHTLAEMRAIYDGHTHGGIQAGGGNTAAPNQAM